MCKKNKKRGNPKDMRVFHKSGFRANRKHTVINNRQHYSRRPSSKSWTPVDYFGRGPGDNEVVFVLNHCHCLVRRTSSSVLRTVMACLILVGGGGGGEGGSNGEVGVARASSN